MQNIKSNFGRKGIRVPDRCPTRAIRHHLGNVNVNTSMRMIELEVRANIARQVAKRGPEAAEWTDSMINHTVRFALWQHEENRAEYAVVMGAAL